MAEQRRDLFATLNPAANQGSLPRVFPSASATAPVSDERAISRPSDNKGLLSGYQFFPNLVASEAQRQQDLKTKPTYTGLDALKNVSQQGAYGVWDTISNLWRMPSYALNRDTRYTPQQQAVREKTADPEFAKKLAEQNQFNKYAEAYNNKFNALMNPTGNMPALNREMAAQQASRDADVVKLMPEAARQQFAEMESQRAAPSFRAAQAANTQTANSQASGARAQTAREKIDDILAYSRANKVNPLAVARWMGMEPTKTDFKDALAREVYNQKMAPIKQEYDAEQDVAKKAAIRQRMDAESLKFLQSLGLY